MPVELRPLVRALSLRKTQVGGVTLHAGTAGGREVVATYTGIGTANATRVTEQVLGAVAVDHLIVMGIAGGVDASVEIGQVVVPTLVIDGRDGTEYQPTPLGDAPPQGGLHTSDDFLLDPEVLAPLRARGVVALDMETAAIGAVCERHGRPWSVFRAISDRVTDGMVDESILGLAKPDGSANLPAALRFILRRPWLLPRLVRISRDMNAATGAATRAAARACREL